MIGSTLATILLQPGYWRASSVTTDVRACWLAEACIGTNNTAETTIDRRMTETISAVVQANNDGEYCTNGYKGLCKYGS
jgi:hypothetical protein